MITISANAQKRLESVLKGEDCLLISVTTGGCNGFSYKYTIQNLPPESQCVLEKPKVYVANSAIEMLEGSMLDFQADELGTSFFIITNPNAISKCGCGNSFSTF